MKSLHWAFDRGLVSLTDSGDIITKERGIDDQIRRLLPTSGRAFLPVDANERPHPSYLAWHREHVFKISA